MDRLYCKYTCDLVDNTDEAFELDDFYYGQRDLTINEKIEKIIGENQLLVSDIVKENFETITDVKWSKAFILDHKTVQWSTYVDHVKKQIENGDFNVLSEEAYIVDSIYRAMFR